MADHEESYDNFAELDVGNLCVTNISLLKSSLEKNFSEERLKCLAVQGAQKLLNEIFKLPSQYHEHVPVAKLPEPTVIIPREKPIPKPKPPTKWEKFAKAKGIKKQRKEKLVFDETAKDWKPRYGYRGIKNQEDWVKEIPDNADPNEDYFGKVKEQKKERIAKNEYHRLRNIASATKMKVTNLESVDRADKHQLARSLQTTKSSTASLGRFVDKLPDERMPKNKMQKRKFKPNNPRNMNEEKENNLKILEHLEKKIPKLNVQEAVQRYMSRPLKEGKTEEQVQSREKKFKSKKNKFVKNKLYRAGKKKH